MTTEPDASRWWGGHGRAEDRLTLLDLVRNDTLDLRTAALLWLLVERKASIVVAAAPQLAGKTTLLTALVDFIPPDYVKVYARGRDENFSFLAETGPSKTYVLIPELSDHTAAYLWGDKVRTLFDALDQGYSMGATIHADAPGEVLGMLEAVGIPDSLVHHVDLIVNLRLSYGRDGMERRMSRLTMVTPGPKLVTVVEWDSAARAFVHHDSSDAKAAIEALTGSASSDVDGNLAGRIETLDSWLTLGPVTATQLQGMVIEHYRGSTT